MEERIDGKQPALQRRSMATPSAYVGGTDFAWRTYFPLLSLEAIRPWNKHKSVGFQVARDTLRIGKVPKSLKSINTLSLLNWHRTKGSYHATLFSSPASVPPNLANSQWALLGAKLRNVVSKTWNRKVQATPWNKNVAAIQRGDKCKTHMTTIEC